MFGDRGRRFADRRQAGRELGLELAARRAGWGEGELLVLGLARGGMPVAAEVAAALGAPLDVCLVRKLGVPGHEELAFGAIGSGSVVVLNDDVVAGLRISDADIDRIAAVEGAELERRARAYRGDRPPLALEGRTVVLVDDGLATGATMRAAVAWARAAGASEVVVAVPVASPDAARLLGQVADRVVCLSSPPSFAAVGAWYDDFTQTTDEEVQRLLGSGASG